MAQTISVNEATVRLTALIGAQSAPAAHAFKVVVELTDGRQDVTFHVAPDARAAIRVAKFVRGYFAPVLYVDQNVDCRWVRSIDNREA